MANASDKKTVLVCLGFDDAGRKIMAEHPPLNVPQPREMLKTLTGRDHTKPKIVDPTTKKQVYPPVPGRDPDPAYVRMLAAHRSTAGASAVLTLSEKWLRSNMCGCMSQRESSKCADKKLFSMKEGLRKYHELTNLRHGAGGAGCCCSTATRAAAKAFGRGGVDAAVRATTCTHVEVPELKTPILDPATSMPTGEFDPCELPCHSCSNGTCPNEGTSCGWAKVFNGLPTQTVTVGTGVASRIVSMPGCALDFGTHQVQWSSWQKVHHVPLLLFTHHPNTLHLIVSLHIEFKVMPH